VRIPSLALLASALLWPPAVSALSNGVGARAEVLGFALGRVQRVPELPAPFPLAPDAVESFELDQPDANDVGIGDACRTDACGTDAPTTAKSSPRRATKTLTSHRTGAAPPLPKRGLRVRADTVLRLANARVMPQGNHVAATGERPEGMRLSGVSALGVGVMDGDVLTSVGGAPASSRQAVVSAVLAARAQRAPLISAVFWRADEPWQLLVEMPYLDPQRASPPPVLVARETNGSEITPPRHTKQP
jgi:hypothetical protein